uniref:Large ribosomal subunit protein uL11m n=1 Tax=Proboscia inermis TaxID=420281 RepID=A0A7S0BXR5_9STRA|mmetsp:Transcript_9306/g.11540  ORF Transcript_9306/g.11540 Transcript_9306/m.11540 type:complete len:151 (+) Transcript_9306:40-492(+)
MSLVRYVMLRVPSGSARPGPAIGQALGPLGINMAEFCKQFNERSEKMYSKETPLGVRLSALSDRSFTFDIRSPPTSYLIKQAAGVSKGSSLPGSESSVVGYITPEQIYEIARIKHTDNFRKQDPLEGVARSVVGTAFSCGIKVREDEDVA